VRSKRFQLNDYGSRAANAAHYGLPFPPDIADEYWRIDIPVDLCAGALDGIIPPENVRMHYDRMRRAGVKVTFRQFEFGHLDFTFAAKSELLTSTLRLLTKD
jgi:pimeloyl-ACP methyl ester carboxylesterase